MPLSSLPKLAAEQLIAMKGEVVHISGPKMISSPTKGKLRKQEAIIKDPTASVSVTLWQEHIDTLELSKTYEFKNFRIKGKQSNRFLITPMNDPFCFTECASFAKPLANINSDRFQAVSTKTVLGSIAGVQRAMKNLECIVYHKNIHPSHLPC